MSGHITRMSRGSSVGSSESRPSSTSRSTSTWRDGPWQACTCTLRSPGSRTRVAGSTLLLAAMSCCSHARRVPSLDVASRPSPRFDDRRRPPSASVRCSSRTSRPSDASRRVADAFVGVVLGSRGATRLRSSSDVPQRLRRVRQPDVDVTVLAERTEQLDLGRPGCGCARRARTAPAGRCPAGRSRSAASTPRWRCVRRGRVDLPRRAVATARAARRGRGRGRRRLRPVVAGLPVVEQGGRCTAYDANSCASRRATA